MTTHLMKPGPVDSLQTRCGIPLNKARKKDLLGTEGNIRTVDCAGCLQDLIVETRIKAMGHGDDAEARWLAGGDTGTSSMTIWSIMTGRDLPNDGAHRFQRLDIPHDPADFGRCHRLLEQFPAWRPGLLRVALIIPAWKPFVDAWDELTALYLEEFPSGFAPKLYQRMKQLAGEGVTE